MPILGLVALMLCGLGGSHAALGVAPALRAVVATAQHGAVPLRAATPALAPWAETVADGCQHVYLDLGSNVGMQVRKLFEPELFPDSAGDSIAVFQRFFGPVTERRANSCAIGVEMNPVHATRLKALESAHSQQGWRTRFFTRTAVGVDFSTGTYDHTGTKDTPLDLSAKVNFAPPAVVGERGESGGRSAGDFSINFINAAELITAVAARKLPSEGAAHIVAKLDIEGGEHLVLPHLLLSGALCMLNYVALEMHPQTLLLDLAVAKLAQQGCRTEISLDDDEKYAFADFALPSAPPQARGRT